MIELERDAGREWLTCRLNGRIDSENAGALQHELEAVLAGPPAPTGVTFDLAAVDYIASAFLRICVTVAKRLPPDGFEIVGCTPFVRKVFAMAGIDRVIRVS